MPEETADNVGELQAALGWAPSAGPEEQAAYARMGGQQVPDAPAAPEAAPAPTPESTPAPAPVAPVAPVVPAPDVDQKLQAKANQEAGDYKRELVAKGWEDQAAHHAATQYARAQYLEAKNTSQNQQLEHQAQNNAAISIGNKHGVDPASLMGYTSPAAMEAGAKALGDQNKRLAALEGAKPGTPKTPSQTFDSGAGTGMTQQQRKIAYATGQINLTTQEYKDLYGR